MGDLDKALQSTPRKRSYIALAAMASTLPFIVLAIVSFERSQGETRREVERAIDVVQRRTATVLSNANAVLIRLAAETQGQCNPDAPGGGIHVPRHSRDRDRQAPLSRVYELGPSQSSATDQ